MPGRARGPARGRTWRPRQPRSFGAIAKAGADRVARHHADQEAVRGGLGVRKERGRLARIQPALAGERTELVDERTAEPEEALNGLAERGSLGGAFPAVVRRQLRGRPERLRGAVRI